jgi:hypothetical protein
MALSPHIGARAGGGLNGGGMRILVQGIKIIAGLAIAWLGYIMLDTARWSQVTALLSVDIPAELYGMRIERLIIGGAVLLLGALSAVSAAMYTVRRT